MEQGQAFDKFEERESTSCERDVLCDARMIEYKWANDFEINEVTYPIDALQERNLFLEGVEDRLLQLAVKIDVDNTQELVDEIKSRYKVKGIEFTNTIRDWLTGKNTPSQDQARRNNCYNFCIALDMDFRTTAEFLFKHFQIMPFNFKNRTDAIYFYCLLHKKNYAIISNMISIAEKLPSTNDDTKQTEAIGRDILEIDSEEEFMHYLETQCYDLEHQCMTARRIVLKLIKENKAIAGVKTDSKLLKAISGYNNQTGGKNEGRIEGKGISKGCLPEKFTKSFPDGTEMSKVENGQKISDYSLRKILILMKFYNYYAIRDTNLKKENIRITTPEQVAEDSDDFCREINNDLAQCGYVQLYPLNMFDWHIIYCVNSKDPIGVLKNLIVQQYFNAGVDSDNEEQD